MAADLVFEAGGTDAPWEIAFDYECYAGPYFVPCSHCGPRQERPWRALNGVTHQMPYCILPRVVMTHGGSDYARVGVCLDCILEAAKTL